MTSDKPLLFSTAIEMLTALRRREISAVELLELHLRQIERHNPAINAIILMDVERARQDAAAADAERAAGRRPAVAWITGHGQGIH